MRQAFLVIALACGMFSAGAAPGLAATTQTIGAGSAVTTVDRLANFDPISVNGITLSDYNEGLLIIGVSGDSWIGDGIIDFDPFHGANGTDRRFYTPKDGSLEWTRIETTDASRIYGIEFMYGNGWTTGDIYGPYPWGNHNAIVEWQTWNGATMVSSGTIGAGPLLEMGTVIGFYDPAGFDLLTVRCTIATSADPNLQSLALDNLRVQLSGSVRHGDANGSGTVDSADIVYLVNYLLGGGAAPASPCGADSNGDGSVTMTDVVYLINYVFAGGPAPGTC